MAFCTQCGASVDDEARFCPACGAAMARTENSGSSISSNPFFSVPDADELMSSSSVERAPATESVNGIQSFTPPGNDTPSGSGSVWFKPSGSEEPPKKEAPGFTPPKSDIPVFKPPGSEESPRKEAPGFTPPKSDIPIFTPPKRPHPAFSGPSCRHHPNEPAVAQCARCGSYVCKDCADVYTLTDGEYANKVLCYDCCEQLVAENVELLKKQKSSIASMIFITALGMTFGFFIFFGAGAGTLWTLFGMLWIGSFGTWVKNAVSAWWRAPGGPSIVGFLGACVGAALVAPFMTAQKIIQGLIYLTKTEKALKTDSEALVQMKDYMEYTQVISQNAGVNLESLMGQGSALYNNSYAQSVRSQGEEAAEAMLRHSATTIAENGEIIRNFAA